MGGMDTLVRRLVIVMGLTFVSMLLAGSTLIKSLRSGTDPNGWLILASVVVLGVAGYMAFKAFARPVDFGDV